MSATVKLDGVYVPSDEIVAREIEGELIIVPLTAGIGDMEDELYTFNDTGRSIWRQLAPGRSLNAVVGSLATEYDAKPAEIEADVLGLVAELLSRRMVVEAVGA